MIAAIAYTIAGALTAAGLILLALARLIHCPCGCDR